MKTPNLASSNHAGVGLASMDAQVGKRLKELADAGLAADTIVFFYADHGSGMPRSKRCAYDSGLHVPLIIYVPEKFRHLAPEEYAPGGKTDRLAGFVDLAPTVLSVADIAPPEYMQGRAFMGRYEMQPREYIYGFRGRMDERYDMVRSVRDERYVYVRNYMPHLPCGQFVEYMFRTPTTRVWKQIHDAGKLTAAQRSWAVRLCLGDEKLFDEWVSTAAVVVQPGRSQPPGGQSADGRAASIAARARAEYRAHPALASLTSEEAYVADAQRVTG